MRRRVSTRGELAVVEASNVQEAISKYMAVKPSRKLAPFTLKWVLQLHREMFGKVWKWAGVLRKADLSIGAPWGQVEGLLFSLLQDLPVWVGNGMALLDQAVLLHYRSVAIHPFHNGNGRWSRLLANIWLKQHDSPVTLWPEQVGHKSPIRDEYLDAIRKADNGDWGPLTELHSRYTSAPLLPRRRIARPHDVPPQLRPAPPRRRRPLPPTSS
jgi:fido (protein-threonine AMPylation protein)